MKKKMLKPIPTFRNEDEERDFWATADTSQYFDFSKARRVIFPNLKLTRRPISLRIQEGLLNQLKAVANRRDMPYQTLMKQYLREAVERDFKTIGAM